MTSYHGGKQRIGKQLSNIIYEESMDIEETENFKIKGYCEPFCGMLGVYQHIPELFKDHKPKLKYKAGDENKSVIMMWKEVKTGWVPPVSVSEKKYNKLKNVKSAEAGYVGHQYSWGGKYFKAYSPNYGKSINTIKASNRVVNIGDKISKVSFTHGSYTQFSKLKIYIIYCDPPYTGTEKHYTEYFDTDAFYDWCYDMSEHNIIFLSEYKAPKDFQMIWSKNVKVTGNGLSNNKKEKLYVL